MSAVVRRWTIRTDHTIERKRKPRRTVLTVYESVAKENGLSLNEFMAGINAGWVTVEPAPGDRRPPFKFVVNRPSEPRGKPPAA